MRLNTYEQMCDRTLREYCRALHLTRDDTIVPEKVLRSTRPHIFREAWPFPKRNRVRWVRDQVEDANFSR